MSLQNVDGDFEETQQATGILESISDLFSMEALINSVSILIIIIYHLQFI